MKRTYQPSKLVRKRRHGFRAHLAETTGRPQRSNRSPPRPGPQAADAPDPGAEAPVAMQRLRRRADFLAAATGVKVPTPAFVLQSRERGDGGGPVRGRLQVSRKVGNAVEQNRARRRLREVVRLAEKAWMAAGHDYVVVGRQGALKRPSNRIQDDFKKGRCDAHKPGDPP